MGQAVVQVKRCHAGGLMEHQTLTQAPEQHERSPTQTLAVLQVLQVIESFTCNQDVSEETLVVKVELRFCHLFESRPGVLLEDASRHQQSPRGSFVPRKLCSTLGVVDASHGTTSK